MDRSPTAPDNGMTVDGPASPKSVEEELFCAEIQRRLLAAEFRATDLTGVPLVKGLCKALTGPKILASRG